jgi:hypothetical protein
LKELTFKEENYQDYQKIQKLNLQIEQLESKLHSVELDYLNLLEESEREEVKG